MNKINIIGVPDKLYYEKLNNGLEIYLIPNTSVKYYDFNLTTRYGSRETVFKRKDEDKYHVIPTGVAHYLEHLTFHMNGYDAGDVFYKSGAYSNAFTSFNRTSYVVSGSNSFKENLEFLLYYVYTPFYNDKTVEYEKGIILSEAKRGLDNPSSEFYYNLCRALYNKKYYRDEVVGSLEDIKKINLSNVMDAYNTFYNPSNMFLVIDGNFDVNEAINIIKNKMSEFNFPKFSGIDVKYPIEDEKVCLEKKIDYAQINVNKVAISYKTSRSNFNKLNLNKYLLDWYLSIILDINFSNTSIFYEDLCISKKLATSISYDTTVDDDYVVITIYISATDKSNIDNIIELVSNNMNNLIVSKKELDRKKKAIISNFIMRFDNSNSVGSYIAYDVCEYGEYYPTFINDIKSLDINIFNEVIKLINYKNRSIYEMLPKKK